MPNPNEFNSKEQRSNEPKVHSTEDVSAKLRAIFRKKQRLALAKHRRRNRCSPSVLFRVMLHVYRRVHRRLMSLLVRSLIGVNFVRVLHRRPDVVKPLD